MADEQIGGDAPGADALATMTAERDALQEKLATAEQAHAALGDKLRAFTDELIDGMRAIGIANPEASGPIDETIAGKAALLLKGIAADRDALESKLAAAEKAVRVATKPQGPKLRTVKAAIDRPPTEDLRELLAGEVEIVFSDGKKEIDGLRPRSVTGDAWIDRPGGIMLRTPVTLDGLVAGTATDLHGFALFVDGKQVAYATLPEPITVRGGITTQLKDTIIF